MMNKALQIKDGKMFYFNTPIAFADEYEKILVADIIFKTKELDNHLQQNWSVRWVENIFSSLISEKGKEPPPAKSVRIWFLNDSIDSSMKFLRYSKFEEIAGGKLNIDDYEIVYDRAFHTNNLDDIFSAFQLGTVENYGNRKLAMGDLIELYDHTQRKFYYIDKVGFKEVVL